MMPGLFTTTARSVKWLKQSGGNAMSDPFFKDGRCCDNCAKKYVCIAAGVVEDAEMMDNCCYSYIPEPKTYTNNR